MGLISFITALLVHVYSTQCAISRVKSFVTIAGRVTLNAVITYMVCGWPFNTYSRSWIFQHFSFMIHDVITQSTIRSVTFNCHCNECRNCTFFSQVYTSTLHYDIAEHVIYNSHDWSNNSCWYLNHLSIHMFEFLLRHWTAGRVCSAKASSLLCQGPLQNIFPATSHKLYKSSPLFDRWHLNSIRPWWQILHTVTFLL